MEDSYCLKFVNRPAASPTSTKKPEGRLTTIPAKENYNNCKEYNLSLCDLKSVVSRKGKENPENIVKEHFWFLRFHFNVAYYLGAIPYKVEWSKEKAKWTVNSSKIRKVFHFVFIVIPICLRQITELPLVFDMVSEQNNSVNGLRPKDYFVILHKLFNFFMFSLFIWITSTKASSMEKLYKIISHSNSFLNLICLETQHKMQTLKWRANLFVGFLYVSIVCGFMFFMIFTFGLRHKIIEKKDLFCKLVMEGQKRFLQADRDYNNSLNLESAIIAAVTGLCRMSYFQAFICMETFFIGTYPVTMFLAAASFEKWIQKLSHVENKPIIYDHYNIMREYERLREFSGEINSTWGVIMLVWVCFHCIKIIIELNDFVSHARVLDVVAEVIMLICLAITMIACGETFKKMEGFRSWLLTRNTRKKFFKYSDPNYLELNMLIQEMESGPIGIGAAGLYKFDYSFISQMLTIVITLFHVSFEK